VAFSGEPLDVAELCEHSAIPNAVTQFEDSVSAVCTAPMLESDELDAAGEPAAVALPLSHCTLPNAATQLDDTAEPD
jgi:hypothetical protein